jgi:hypothetical protein
MPEPNDQDSRSPSERSAVARWVLIVSGIVLVSSAAVLVTMATDRSAAADRAFSMLVPMIGTWIGTVIAYYFSGENFVKASQSVSKLVDQITTEKLKTIPVTQAMIPRANVKFVQLPAGNDESAVNFKSGLIDLYVDPVTRLPVLDDQGRVKYIIHQSLVYKYLADQALSAGTTPFNVATQSLKDFLDHGTIRTVAANTLAFVQENATLADAKSRMEAMSDCQDVFVTSDATNSKPMIGWLPNTEITKRSRA